MPKPSGSAERCHLVYALASEGISARRANELLNEYVADGGRGVCVSHDHFVGRPHGGFAVFHVRNAKELAHLDDPGPLAGWEIRAHPLTFSLTAVGFAAQIEFTLRHYGGTTLAELAEAEGDDRRYWWRRRRGA